MPKESNVVFIYNQDDVNTWVNEIIQENIAKADGKHDKQYNLLKDYKNVVTENDKFAYLNLVIGDVNSCNFGLLKEVEESLSKNLNENDQSRLEYAYRLADHFTNKKEAHMNNPEGFHQKICLPLKNILNKWQEKDGNFPDPEERLSFINELHELYLSADSYLAGHSENAPYRSVMGSNRIHYAKTLKNYIESFVLGFNYRYMNQEQRGEEKEKLNQWYRVVRKQTDGNELNYIKEKAGGKPVIAKRTYSMSGKEELAKFDQAIHSKNPVNQEASDAMTAQQIINTEYGAISAKISKYVRTAVNGHSGMDKLVKAAEALAGTFSQEHNEKDGCFNKLINEPLRAYAAAKGSRNPAAADTALTQMYYEACLYLNTHKNPHTDKGQACKAFAKMIKNVSSRCIHHECIQNVENKEINANIQNNSQFVISM